MLQQSSGQDSWTDRKVYAAAEFGARKTMSKKEHKKNEKRERRTI